jgi:predicted flap endonuclease-1-like 5' DNA nuclease
MSTIVSTVLVAAPLAFLAGWILSKVVFRHISLTRPNAEQSRGAEPLSAPVAGGSAGAGQSSGAVATDARRVNMLRQKLAAARAESQSLHSEIQLLKEAAAEREHAVVDLKRKLQMQLKVPEQSLKSSPAREKQLIQQLEGRLATHQHRIDELKHELEVADLQAKRTGQRFSKWRQKFKPMARQFRQQRTIIKELREELRQRDLEQQKLAAARLESEKPATVQQDQKDSAAQFIPAEACTPAAAEPVARVVVAPASLPAETSADLSSDDGDQEREDLQALRGIGPALHKKLNAKGIYRLQQLAYMSSHELSRLGESLGVSQKLLSRHQWIKQARQLLNMPVQPVAEQVEA